MHACDLVERVEPELAKLVVVEGAKLLHFLQLFVNRWVATEELDATELLLLRQLFNQLYFDAVAPAEGEVLEVRQVSDDALCSFVGQRIAVAKVQRPQHRASRCERFNVVVGYVLSASAEIKMLELIAMLGNRFNRPRHCEVGSAHAVLASRVDAILG